MDPPSTGLGRSWALWAASQMVQRGPDGSGYWCDESSQLHLSFRRLAIIDLSDAGHQPMVGVDGNSAIVFNGELYGHRSLRAELEAAGTRFRGHSDTEVVLAALERWGEHALDRFDGMFALAWWHAPSQRLLLARDHAGIKPLFIGNGPGGQGVSFASQYDVVANGPWGVRDLDPEALALYLELHHVPAPHGLVQGTGQLEPGEALIVEQGRIRSRRRWWVLPGATEQERGQEAVDRVASLLDRSVQEQVIADRPLGTFLSGGVDSALVTSVAAGQIDGELHSFTVSFPGASSDEAAKASEFASAIGVTHHVIELTEADVDRAVSDAIDASAEPIGDFSIIPTTALAGFAASHVTVALSGDGGDELYYGYVRPWSLLRSGRWFAAPRSVRRGRYYAGRLAPRVIPPASEAITASTPGQYYRSVNSRSGALAGTLRAGLPEAPPLWWYETPSRAGRDALVALTRQAEYYGQLQRVLRKVDLASMHHSLEVRVPILSRKLVEASGALDVEFCLRNGLRKGPLRDLLGHRVPSVAQQTAKQGFTPPLRDWLDGPLKARVDDQVHGSWCLDGALDVGQLRAVAAPLAPDRHWNLWTVLSLEWWMQRIAAMPRNFEEIMR